MKHTIHVDVGQHAITLDLDDSHSINTVNELVKRLPFEVNLNVWGEEIYSSESPSASPRGSARSPVDLYDVAYWPAGKAICLFYGPSDGQAR